MIPFLFLRFVGSITVPPCNKFGTHFEEKQHIFLVHIFDNQ